MNLLKPQAKITYLVGNWPTQWRFFRKPGGDKDSTGSVTEGCLNVDTLISMFLYVSIYTNLDVCMNLDVRTPIFSAVYIRVLMYISLSCHLNNDLVVLSLLTSIVLFETRLRYWRKGRVKRDKRDKNSLQV